MVTTIQIQEKTLHWLKKIKQETNAESYDDAINKLIQNNLPKKSMAGILGKKTKEWIMKDLRDKSDRF